MNPDHDRAEQILDAALLLGERQGWDAVHLHEVARELGIGLAESQQHYGQKDDLADAWFDRADRALLRAGEGAEWLGLPVRERLLRTMLAWFDALAPHRGLDRSPDARRTRAWLEARLVDAERMALRLPNPPAPWTPSPTP